MKGELHYPDRARQAHRPQEGGALRRQGVVTLRSTAKIRALGALLTCHQDLSMGQSTLTCETLPTFANTGGMDPSHCQYPELPSPLFRCSYSISDDSTPTPGIM